MDKKVFNINTARGRMDAQKKAKARPKRTIDNPDETIEKAVIKFTEAMITVIPELVNNLKSCVDKALDELTKATKEANKK